MTLAQSLNLSTDDLMNMNMKELRSVGKTIFGGMNKRISRLEQAENIAEDALNKARAEGRFSAKGKDKDRLINEIRRAQRFGKNPTSTVSGARQVFESRKGNGITGRETSIINTWLRMVDNGEVVYSSQSEIVAQVKGYASVVSELDFSEYSDEEVVYMIIGGQTPGEMVGENLDEDWSEFDDEFWD